MYVSVYLSIHPSIHLCLCLSLSLSLSTYIYIHPHLHISDLDPAIVQENDAVGARDGRQPMGNPLWACLWACIWACMEA